MAKGNLGLPANVLAMLAQADKQRNFPAGTMASVMQQETGGNAKYLTDPSTYHYGLNSEGRRIAGHTGKVSTAFGPFGILESTGADPGYGVKPLQNKSLEEQVRFASEYLDARSKSAGSLQAGLAGYGEGTKYSNQVARRRDGGSATSVVAQAAPVPQEVQLAPVEVAAAPGLTQAEPAVLPVQQAAPVVVAEAQAVPPVEVQQTMPPEWSAFQQSMPKAVRASDLQYGQQMAQAPMQAGMQGQPNFNPFKAWGVRS